MSVQQPWEPLTRRWRDLPLRDFTGARCKGLWWMFDSTDPATHREAAALCRECPVRRECRAYLDDVTTASAGVSSGGGPSGTWAGLMVSKLGKRKRLKPQVRPTIRTPVRVGLDVKRGPDRANESDPLATNLNQQRGGVV